jgi:hypothetical protein
MALVRTCATMDALLIGTPPTSKVNATGICNHGGGEDIDAPSACGTKCPCAG